MKTQNEIRDRLWELDGSYIPREAGGRTPLAEIKSLLWVIDEDGEYTIDDDDVYVDLFTNDDEVIKYGCTDCGKSFDGVAEFQKHLPEDHNWDAREDRPSIRKGRFKVDSE